MRTEWRGDQRKGSPSRLSTYTIALFIFSMLTVAGVWYARYLRVWTPLERHYLPAYVRAQITGMFRDNGSYTLLQIVTRKDTRLALDNDVVPAVTESGENTFVLTKEAVKQGALRLQLHLGGRRHRSFQRQGRLDAGSRWCQRRVCRESL